MAPSCRMTPDTTVGFCQNIRVPNTPTDPRSFWVRDKPPPCQMVSQNEQPKLKETHGTRFSQTVPSKPDAPPRTFLGPIQVPLLAPEKVPVNVSLEKIPAVETHLKSVRVPTKDVHVCMHVFVFMCFCACVCMPTCAHMEGGLVCLKKLTLFILLSVAWLPPLLPTSNTEVSCCLLNSIYTGRL